MQVESTIIDLRCVLEFDVVRKSNVSWTWKKDNKITILQGFFVSNTTEKLSVVDIKRYEVERKENELYLRIKDAIVDDEGVYTCSFTNENGEHFYDFNVKVVSYSILIWPFIVVFIQVAVSIGVIFFLEKRKRPTVANIK